MASGVIAPPSKLPHNFAASDQSKVKSFCATLCRHRGSSRNIKNVDRPANFTGGTISRFDVWLGKGTGSCCWLATAPVFFR